MEQQPEAATERSGRLLARLPHPTRSFSRSRSRSPSGRDDDANMYALSRPAGEGRDSGDEPSPVRETAPTTRAEEPMALSRPRWNAAPMERGLDGMPRASLDPNSDNLPFTGGRDHFDVGLELQKLRGMNGPEMERYINAEMDRADLATMLVETRMWIHWGFDGARRAMEEGRPGLFNFPDEPRGHTSHIPDQSSQSSAPGAVPQKSAPAQPAASDRRQKQTDAQSKAGDARFWMDRTSSPPPRRVVDPREGSVHDHPPPRDEDYRRPPPQRDGDQYRRSPPRDDVLGDIGPALAYANSMRVHFRDLASREGLNSTGLTVRTGAAQAWMHAHLAIQRQQAQQMVNGSSESSPPANPGNAPPPPQGPTPPVSEDNSPLPFNQSDCDFGAVMQKLRGMDGPEAAAWAIAETDRAGLAKALIMNRMYCYAHQESERRVINNMTSGGDTRGPVFHATDDTLPLWDSCERPGPHLNHPRQDHGAACQDPGISPALALGPTPDQVELAKCRRALAAAKRALEDIHEPLKEPSSPEYFRANARARAAYGLADISEALEGEAL